jgi:hypothetical protein
MAVLFDPDKLDAMIAIHEFLQLEEREVLQHSSTNAIQFVWNEMQRQAAASNPYLFLVQNPILYHNCLEEYVMNLAHFLLT